MPKSSIDVTSAPECVDCGCCCFSFAPNYLQVAGCDYDRLGDHAEDVTEWQDNQVFMKMSADGHCAALTYDAPTKRYLCSIYEVRPDVCRSLERGTGQCRGEMRAKFERRLVMLRSSK